MAYFSKQFQSEVVLPDGTVAQNVSDIDKYLQRSGLAMAGDYSSFSLKQARLAQKKQWRQELFANFIHNYKRNLWYGK